MSLETRRVRKDLERCAAKANVIITGVYHSGKHTKIHLRCNGVEAITVVAGDSKDWRALQNITTQFKRAIREKSRTVGFG